MESARHDSSQIYRCRLRTRPRRCRGHANLSSNALRYQPRAHRSAQIRRCKGIVDDQRNTSLGQLLQAFPGQRLSRQGWPNSVQSALVLSSPRASFTEVRSKRLQTRIPNQTLKCLLNCVRTAIEFIDATKRSPGPMRGRVQAAGRRARGSACCTTTTPWWRAFSTAVVGLFVGDIAKDLEVEERGTVVNILKNVASVLVDRGCACACGWAWS